MAESTIFPPIHTPIICSQSLLPFLSKCAVELTIRRVKPTEPLSTYVTNRLHKAALFIRQSYRIPTAACLILSSCCKVPQTVGLQVSCAMALFHLSIKAMWLRSIRYRMSVAIANERYPMYWHWYMCIVMEHEASVVVNIIQTQHARGLWWNYALGSPIWFQRC